MLAPDSSDLLTMLSYHVVAKMFNVNTSENAAECLKMFGLCDVAEAVATRKDRFVKRYALSSSEVYVICSICS